MAQPSIANYFATRKRSAVDEANIQRAKKVLILDPSDNKRDEKLGLSEKDKLCDVIYLKNKELAINNNTINRIKSDRELKFPERKRVVAKLNFDTVQTSTSLAIKKATPKLKSKKATKDVQNQDIQMLFQKLQHKNETAILQKTNEKTPPCSPVKNAMDNMASSDNLSLNDIKNKLTRSSRLAELKASISRFNKGAEKLKEIEKKTATITQQSPTIKAFKSIELEVQISPKKSPMKSYLSPKKEVGASRKVLFGSPVKSSSPTSPLKAPAYQRFQTLASPGKPSLTLPYKYRNLAEIFRSIDTVSAMLYNRKETITFNKLKPAVQEMLRRNLYPQHFAQIQTLVPNAFSFNWEKVKCFTSREDKYELVIKPNVEEAMNPTLLLERRRELFDILIEKVKDYHNEFLLSLDPPLIIPRDTITRWHPEFDIEKIPDITKTELPQKPEEEKLTSGKDVLDKARSLFSCNTRMEKALEKLKQIQETKSITEEKKEESPPVQSALKGIPKALLEKIRAKQSAKALDAMTRSATQDKDSLMYSRLPDLARLMRNTFVAEKKGVLPLEDVIIKLNNSYRSYLTNTDIEEHLRLISKVVPGWIMFHEIRRTLFVKLSRDADMHKVLTRLEELAKEKSGL